MKNVALEATGAQVSHTTSWDPNHAPETVIDGSDVTFWTTTGLFPQELIITFDSVVQVEAIESRTFNVKNMKILRSVSMFPTEFNEICSSDIPENENGQQQRFSHKVNATAVRHLKFVFVSGWDDFVGVYSLEVLGENVDLKQRF
eukprot:m.375140 g.375140  ORF g.375140 m.375140 type:complete len:145 (-) comp16698_c0_seq3:3806-4240(-)